MRIFFAGPLTTLENPEKTKALYTKMGDIARANGFEYFWAFQSGTDPVKNPNVEPQYIYEKDLYELSQSNLMIAYVGEATTGTGQELEYAKEHGIPIYLMHQTNQHVSRMILGNPAVQGVIVYDNESDALTKLHTVLQQISQRVTPAVITDSPTDVTLKEE